ncbi:phosphohistidine phosphatase SixA [Aestuariibacter salexigens]|uniref:phosphohistidine phosphatase SixA n=1 Tax=Aestuariibacter salexigens TaxID=226010 RepID=UPI000424FBA1|nr:phosphohistidine phosphatase SixA [Aestuariibacter salexigens]
MYVFVMRHGEAQLPAANDRERQLTEKGYAQSAATAQWLAQHYLTGNKIERVFNSPFRRTRQTQSVIADYFDIAVEEESEDITPSGNPHLFHDYLDHIIDTEHLTCSVMIVSHMPFVSYMVDALTQHHHSMLFATAGVAVVEYDAKKSTGKLVDHFHPVVSVSDS